MKKFVGLMLLFLSAAPAVIFAEDDNGADRIEQGRALAFERRKGNCLACHLIEGGDLTGNYGPPLIMMAARFPDRDVLRAQIWDASARMPDTRMPPYGRHRILTEEEIDLVVDFILTL
jgi:L-cysteine S-thiosulfotransferase